MQSNKLFNFAGERIAASAELQAAAEKAIMTPLQASRDPEKAPVLRAAIRTCARYGVDIDPTSEKRLSIVAVDRALKESKTSLEDRFRVKAMLGQAGLL